MDDRSLRRVGAAPAAYDPFAVSLHWTLAALLAASFFVGLYMVDLHFSPLRVRLFNWHKWAGMAVLALSIARLVWRAAGHPAPALPLGRARLAARRLSRDARRLLPSLPRRTPARLALHLGGGRAGRLVRLAGAAGPGAVDKPLADGVFKPLHAFASYVLAALVVLHVAAALQAPVRRPRPSSRSHVAVVAEPEELLTALGWPRLPASSSSSRSLRWLRAHSRRRRPRPWLRRKARFASRSGRAGCRSKAGSRASTPSSPSTRRRAQGGSVTLSVDSASASVGFADSDAELPRREVVRQREIPARDLPVERDQERSATAASRSRGRSRSRAWRATSSCRRRSSQSARDLHGDAANSSSSGSTTGSATPNGPMSRSSRTTCGSGSSWSSPASAIRRPPLSFNSSTRKARNPCPGSSSRLFSLPSAAPSRPLRRPTPSIPSHAVVTFEISCTSARRPIAAAAGQGRHGRCSIVPPGQARPTSPST